MSDLQFDDSQSEFARPPEQPSGFDLSGKLVEWGLVSNRQEATYVLIAIGVLAVIVAFFVFRVGGGGSDAPPLLPQ